MTRLKGFWSKVKFWEKERPQKPRFKRVNRPNPRIMSDPDNVLFSVHGDALDAFYSSGGKTAGYLTGSASGVPTVTADASAVEGSVIDLPTQGGLHYNGNLNWTETGDFSLLMNCKFNSLGGISLMFSCGFQSRQGFYNTFEVFLQTDWKVYYSNDQGIIGMNKASITQSGLTTTDYHDVVFTWDNTAKVFSVYVDGVLNGTATSSRQYLHPGSISPGTRLSFGHGNFWHQCYFDLAEVVIVDEVWDSAYIADLDGLRTEYLVQTAFDGQAGSGGGGGGGLKRHGGFGIS